MAEYTLDTLPLHALHSYSANLLATWFGVFCTDEELAQARTRRPLGRYYVIVEIVQIAANTERTERTEGTEGTEGTERIERTERIETRKGSEGTPRVRVAEMKETIAEARGRVAVHAPFARVATLRHDAASHDEWPGSEDAIGLGDEFPAAMFDWTR